MLTEHRPPCAGVDVGEAMRFRGKSIRRKIVALLLVPLVSLTAIWAFATYLTGREAEPAAGRRQHRRRRSGYPVEDAVQALQQERRQTLVYLADPRAVRRARRAAPAAAQATDEAVGRLARRRRHDGRPRRAERRAPSERLDRHPQAPSTASARSAPQVEDGTVDRDQALECYNALVDPCYAFLAAPRTPWRTWRWTSRAARWSASPGPAKRSPARTP